MSLFRVQDHVLDASYIREYPRALADEEETDLKVSVKQYTPLDNSSPRTGDITIIGGHANGFPKELYEPLWDEFYHCLKARNLRIRTILVMEVAHQGTSGIINEAKLGNDPSWMDGPRDLFLMVNHFRSQIKAPIIGIGHSMGGANLVNLSLMHPRLFTSLVLIDPVIQRLPNVSGNFMPAKASSVRRDRWPSREAAEIAFKKSKFYQSWDARVLDLWLKYGLRDLPTYLYPSSAAGSGPQSSATNPARTSSDDGTTPTPPLGREVTLATTKHQEVLTFSRASPPESYSPSAYPQPGLPSSLTHPDFDPSVALPSPFYRPEAFATFHRLPFVRPSVLYIFAEHSALSDEPLKADKLAHTGTGVGGSGGVRAGRVKSVTMPEVGHLIPMEAVRGTAEECVKFIGPEVVRWAAEREMVQREWEKVPRRERGLMSREFAKVIGGDWIASMGGQKGKASKL